MQSRAAMVGYKKTVSDPWVQRLLEAMANHLGRDIIVHGGDRHHVPSGGSQTSHHLEGRAADFHVMGMSDSQAFAAMVVAADALPSFPDQRFDLIHHGPYTQTEGEHLHLGHLHVLQRKALPWSIAFRTEGLIPDGKGKYPVVGHSTTKCYPAP